MPAYLLVIALMAAIGVLVVAASVLVMVVEEYRVRH